MNELTIAQDSATESHVIDALNLENFCRVTWKNVKQP